MRAFYILITLILVSNTALARPPRPPQPQRPRPPSSAMTDTTSESSDDDDVVEYVDRFDKRDFNQDGMVTESERTSAKVERLKEHLIQRECGTVDPDPSDTRTQECVDAKTSELDELRKQAHNDEVFLQVFEGYMDLPATRAEPVRTRPGPVRLPSPFPGFQADLNLPDDLKMLVELQLAIDMARKSRLKGADKEIRKYQKEIQRLRAKHRKPQYQSSAAALREEASIVSDYEQDLREARKSGSSLEVIREYQLVLKELRSSQGWRQYYRTEHALREIESKFDAEKKSSRPRYNIEIALEKQPEVTEEESSACSTLRLRGTDQALPEDLASKINECMSGLRKLIGVEAETAGETSGWMANLKRVLDAIPEKNLVDQVMKAAWLAQYEQIAEKEARIQETKAELAKEEAAAQKYKKAHPEWAESEARRAEMSRRQAKIQMGQIDEVLAEDRDHRLQLRAKKAHLEEEKKEKLKELGYEPKKASAAKN